MNSRRSFISALIALVLVAAVSLPSIGCVDQNATAALINVVGASVNTLISIQGDPALAAKVSKDFAAASAAVASWKKGDATQSIVQALNLVQADINLIPVSDQTKIYIQLAITTVNSIIAIVTPAPAGMTAKRATKPLVSDREYKAQWNALTAAHPSAVPVIK